MAGQRSFYRCPAVIFAFGKLYLPSASYICLRQVICLRRDILLRKVLFLPSGEAVAPEALPERPKLSVSGQIYCFGLKFDRRSNTTLASGQNITFSRKAENITLTTGQNTTLAKGQNITELYLPSASYICLTASYILLSQSVISPVGRSCGFIHNFGRRPKYHAGNLHITFSRKAENITLVKGQNITLTESQNTALPARYAGFAIPEKHDSGLKISILHYKPDML